MLRIVIAEDHETVRQGLRMIVDHEEDMEVVGEAGDGRAAIELAKKLHPDIVLMDISMPELNGLRAAATLKRMMPEMKIITLTRHTDEAYMQELFAARQSELLHAAGLMRFDGLYAEVHLFSYFFIAETERYIV